jgi:mersacidin/lichenicidin family type 2 lantibiotic
MNNAMIVRAWKSPEYRASLPHEQRAALPESPSGRPLTELDDAELDDITGGAFARLTPTAPDVCCLYTQQCPTFAMACRDLES